MKVRVKICGITSYEDAALALDLGADALGFNFYPPSPRFIEVTAARAIIRRLPPFAVTVGVFVNAADPAEVAANARAAGVEVLQLHGDEPAEYGRALGGWPLIKAVRVDKDGFRVDAFDFPAQAFLLDAKDELLFGGTGKTFDWQMAQHLIAGVRIVLAGGLNPENVCEAIRVVRPYAVDVCSGVENRPGKKDADKLAALMREVTHAFRQ